MSSTPNNDDNDESYIVIDRIYMPRADFNTYLSNNRIENENNNDRPDERYNNTSQRQSNDSYQDILNRLYRTYPSYSNNTNIRNSSNNNNNTNIRNSYNNNTNIRNSSNSNNTNIRNPYNNNTNIRNPYNSNEMSENIDREENDDNYNSTSNGQSTLSNLISQIFNPSTQSYGRSGVYSGQTITSGGLPVRWEMIYDNTLVPQEEQTVGVNIDDLSNYTTIAIYSTLNEDETIDIICPICQSDFEPNDIVRKINNCSHICHSVCLERWFGNHNTCPICRTSVVVENIDNMEHVD